MMVAPTPTPVQPVYETDVSDAEWELVRPHVDVRAKTRPQRTVDLRIVLHARLYKVRTGCQWRLLPRGFPPRSTVSYYFQQWAKKGVLMRINDILRQQVRTVLEGRNADPSAGVIDTQSVKSTEVGGPERGVDGGKKVNGRKRHLLVDTLGLLITVIVHAATSLMGMVPDECSKERSNGASNSRKSGLTRPTGVICGHGWRTHTWGIWRSLSVCLGKKAFRYNLVGGWSNVPTLGWGATAN